MYKKILVPLDGSDFSARILPHVKAIAAGCKISEVILFMVGVAPRDTTGQAYVDVYGGGLSLKNKETKVKKAETASRKYLSQIAADLKQEGIAAKTVITWGNPAEEILDYIKNNQVDLVMMSTHGRTGSSRWLLGSVTERVMRHSVAPVFVAPPMIPLDSGPAKPTSYA